MIWIILGWIACSVLGYLLDRLVWTDEFGDDDWTIGTRAIFLFLSATGPVCLIAAFLFWSVAAAIDSDTPAKW